MKKFSYDPDSYGCSQEQLFTPPGTFEKDKLALDFPKSGGLALKKVGVTPTYQMVQAARASCDLANVIESVQHPNQFDVLNQEGLNEVVVDFTGASNLGDLYVATKRIENSFYDLPLEVREEFNGDLKQFVREIGTQSYHDKLQAGFDRYNGITHSNIQAGTQQQPPTPSVSQKPLLNRVEDKVMDGISGFVNGVNGKDDE